LQIEPTHKEHLTPASEIESRHNRLKSAMATAGVDAVWIDKTVPLYYFTGSVQRATLIVPADGAPRYVVRKSLERARAESPLEAEPFAGRGALYEAFTEAGTRLGVDLTEVSAADYLRMTGALGDIEIVDVSGILRGLRMVKSDWEVTQIRRATDVAKAGFNAIPTALTPGITELELSSAVESAMRRVGHQGRVRTVDHCLEDFGPNLVSGDTALYPTSTNSMVGSAGPFHGSAGCAGWREIQTGDTVMADIASTFNGYTADNTRVFFVGSELPDTAARAQDFCIEILRRAEQLMVPGAVCEEIYDGVDRWAERTGKPEGYLGFGENRQKFLGHGVGLQLDELPVLARKVGTRLEPGMILAVEPKVILPGIGPVGVENTYVITEGGCESLCDFDEGVTVCG